MFELNVNMCKKERNFLYVPKLSSFILYRELLLCTELCLMNAIQFTLQFFVDHLVS